MKAQILKPGPSAFVGLLLTLPVAYFFLINILNEAGSPGLYNAALPLMQSLGLSESPGLNINGFILLAPVIAMLLNLTSILRFDWQADSTFIDVQLRLERRWTNWMVLSIGASCLLMLFIYLAGENASGKHL